MPVIALAASCVSYLKLLLNIKLRWGMAGRGKPGGVRIIYYWRRDYEQLWMLMIYAKNEEENVPTPLVRRLREEIDRD